MIPSPHSWFNPASLLLTTAFFLCLLFALAGAKPLIKQNWFKPIFYFGILLTLATWYVSARQFQEKEDMIAANKLLRANLDHQSRDLEKTRGDLNRLLALGLPPKKETPIPTPQPGFQPPELTPLEVAINHLNQDIAWGNRVLEECSNGRLSYPAYLREREDWLGDVRNFLRNNPLFQSKDRWKTWYGYGDARGEGFEVRDVDWQRRKPCPPEAPADRREDYTDIQRRLDNLGFYKNALMTAGVTNSEN